MKKKQTIFQLLEVMGGFSEKVDLELLTIKTDLVKTNEDVYSNRNRINHIENVMATNNYLNYKMADLKGELLEMIRSEFKKLKADRSQPQRESNPLIRDKI